MVNKIPANLKTKDLCLIGIGTGCNKLISDFKYIFDGKLKIVDFAEYDIITSLPKNNNSFYVCCTYDRKGAKKQLDAAGLKYKIDYYFAEDLFCLLDDMKESKIAFVSYPGSIRGWLKSIIFGYAAKHAIILPENKYGAVLKGRYESDRIGAGRRILFIYALYLILGLPSALLRIHSKKGNYSSCDHICFCDVSDSVRFIKDYPTVVNKVITLEELLTHTMAPLYMRAVYFDRRQNDCSCDTPFNTVWIGRYGTARLCDCPDFLDISCGNIGVTDISDVWHSPLAKIIRLSVINNTYTFCNEKLCARLAGGKTTESFLERREVIERDHPLTLNFACDYLCNLHCPSCRKALKVKNDEDEDIQIDSCIDALLKSGWLDKADTLLVGGGGEAFFSGHYKRVLYDTNVKRNSIVIMTNGTLFSRREWDRLEGKYEHVSFLVSVDAATKETYERVRCGGNFERLMENMDFLSDLRKKNKVDKVTVILIVQRANYKEIPDFIRWAKDKGFDNVNLSHIRNWGSFDDRDFYENVSMFDKNGKIKPELAAVLKDPACCDEIVSMSWNPD